MKPYSDFLPERVMNAGNKVSTWDVIIANNRFPRAVALVALQKHLFIPLYGKCVDVKTANAMLVRQMMSSRD